MRIYPRHGRTCSGHPRLIACATPKTWMSGTRPGMTTSEVLTIALRWVAAGALFLTMFVQPASADDAFQSWLQSLWPQAQELGVSRATFDTATRALAPAPSPPLAVARATFAPATRGLEPDLSLPDLVLPGRPEKAQGGQPEFVQTPADYLKE